MKANRRRIQLPDLGTATEALTSDRLGISPSWRRKKCQSERCCTVSSDSDMDIPSDRCVATGVHLCQGSTLCNRLYFIVLALCARRRGRGDREGGWCK